MIFTGCQKNVEIPPLTTTPVSDVTSTSGVAGGNVTIKVIAELAKENVFFYPNKLKVYDATITSPRKSTPGAFA